MQVLPIVYSLFPPLGLATLASFCNENDEIEIVDEYVENVIIDDMPDLVCIQTYITNAQRAYELADIYRNKGCKVAIGGLHATSLPLEAKCHADVLFTGLVETSFPRFLQDFRNHIGGMMMDVNTLPIEAFQTALLQIDRIKADEIFENCYLENKSFEALEHLTMGALENIGTGWEEGEFSLSQVYMSGVICEEMIEKYMPKFSITIKKEPRIGIAVLQDHHALGKRIVYSVLRAGGYDIIDFGQGLSVEEIVEKTIGKQVDFLLISTLMLSSALQVKTVVEKLREINSPVKIIVGGAPFRMDNSLWKKVDADADGKNGTKVSKIIDILARGGKC